MVPVRNAAARPSTAQAVYKEGRGRLMLDSGKRGAACQQRPARAAVVQFLSSQFSRRAAGEPMPCASGGVPLAVDLWAVRGLAALRDMDPRSPPCTPTANGSTARAIHARKTWGQFEATMQVQYYQMPRFFSGKRPSTALQSIKSDDGCKDTRAMYMDVAVYCQAAIVSAT